MENNYEQPSNSRILPSNHRATSDSDFHSIELNSVISCASKPESSFSEDHFHELWKHEDKHFWFEYRNDFIGWALTNFFGPIGNFLEIGCGNGFVLAALEKANPTVNFVGVDLFYEGLVYARRRMEITTLARMDFLQPAFCCQFDVVGIFDVLEHISDDELALEKLYDLVKPEGGAIITVPQHPFLWAETDRISFHKRRYKRSDLLKKLSGAGFRTIHASSFLTLLLPVLAFSRLLRRRALTTLIQNELNIPPTLNRVLRTICNVEGLILKKGFSAPCGGSLLVVVRKVS